MIARRLIIPINFLSSSSRSGTVLPRNIPPPPAGRLRGSCVLPRGITSLPCRGQEIYLPRLASGGLAAPERTAALNQSGGSFFWLTLKRYDEGI